MNTLYKWTFLMTVLITQFALFDNATSPKNLRKWPNNQIYFRFVEQSDEAKLRIMRNAIKALENIVCVNITETTELRMPGGDEPVLVVDNEGCWSYMGVKKQKPNRPHKPQEVSLNSYNCQSDSTTKHEFMHLLGLNHEQSRSDRDEYINLDEKRIEDGQENQFKVEPDDNYGPFDFQSNMIYTPWETTKLPGRPAWTVKKGQGKYDQLLEQGSISWQDAKALNKIYECGAHCKNECGREAYLNKNCECVTPDKFAEQQCFDIRDDCKSWRPICRSDYQLTGECRKTCNTCYKSANGVGRRDTIEICDDSVGFCSELDGQDQSAIHMACQDASVKFFCRKTCKSGCLYKEIPKVVDKCQDLDPKSIPILAMNHLSEIIAQSLVDIANN